MNVEVEELIGWRRTSIPTRRDGDGHWHTGAWEVRRPGDVMPDRHAARAEVDDLANWLADRSEVVHVYGARYGWVVTTRQADGWWEHDGAHFPTIRAALVDAVRAVHEQEARRECQNQAGCPDSPVPCPDCPVRAIHEQERT